MDLLEVWMASVVDATSAAPRLLLEALIVVSCENVYDLELKAYL